ncbi:MAG: hypothetical protein WC955_12510 [Elusimicrobiota bacterium]
MTDARELYNLIMSNGIGDIMKVSQICNFISKTIFLFGLIMLFVSSFGFAEVNNSLAFNVIGLLKGNINASYELGLNNKSSLKAGVTYFGSKRSDWEVSLNGASLGYNIYLDGKRLQGFFLGPVVGVSILSAKYTYFSYEYNGNYKDTVIEQYSYVQKTVNGNLVFLTVAGNLGYKWIFGGFTLVLNIGTGYSGNSLTLAGENVPFVGDSLTDASINIGWSF